MRHGCRRGGRCGSVGDDAYAFIFEEKLFHLLKKLQLGVFLKVVDVSHLTHAVEQIGEALTWRPRDDVEGRRSDGELLLLLLLLLLLAVGTAMYPGSWGEIKG